MPLMAAFKKEGGDPSAAEAIKFIAEKAIKQMLSGEVKTMKRPPMAWNADTNRFDFLRRRKRFSDSHADTWQRTQVEKAVPTEVVPPQASQAAGSKRAPPGEPAAGSAEPAAKKSKGTPGKGGGGGKAAKGGDDEVDAEKQKKKMEAQAIQKELAAEFKKADSAKKNYDKFLNASTDLETIVKTNPSWSYFNNDAGMKDLREALLFFPKKK